MSLARCHDRVVKLGDGVALDHKPRATCAVCLVQQMNMIGRFRGPAIVESIMAPYVCASCSAERMVELEVSALRKDPLNPPESAACTDCGGRLEFDESPERYFRFIICPE